jgi:LAO/AO transport system kinase
MRLFSLGASGWRPEVLRCSAIHDQGLDRVWESLQRYQTHTQQNGFWQQRRAHQAMQWMEDTIQHLLDQSFHQDGEIHRQLAAIRQSVSQGEQSPTQAAETLVRAWLARRGENQ